MPRETKTMNVLNCMGSPYRPVGAGPGASSNPAARRSATRIQSDTERWSRCAAAAYPTRSSLEHRNCKYRSRALGLDVFFRSMPSL